MKKLRIAFCGLGNAAFFYFEKLKKFSNERSIELIAGFDSDVSQIKNWESKTNIPSFQAINKVSDMDIDLVIVTTPSGSHTQDSLSFLKRGVNVLCEKPIGLIIDEINSNIKYAKDHNLEYGGVFQNRFNKPISFIKNKIEEGVFGRIISSSIKLQWSRPQSYYEDGWHGTWLHDGGVINQQAIHHIDALFFLLGDPNEMIGFSGNVVNQLEAEDTFVGAGTLSKGGFFTIEASTAIRPDDLQASIEIIGSDAQVGIGGPAINNLDYFIEKGMPVPEEVLETNSEKVINGFGNGHSKMLKKIIDHWEHFQELKLPITASESLNAVQAVHCFYRSVEDKKVTNFEIGLGSNKLGRN